jgi:feruloyl esterase
MTILRHRTLLRLLLAGAGLAGAAPAFAQAAEGDAARCAALATGGIAWPDTDTRVISAVWREAGAAPQPAAAGRPPQPPLALPAHCELIGSMHARTGVDGQPYAIRFHVRLPGRWNGKFFMQGGGGSNGELGDAIGKLGGGTEPALVQGYAVMSQDSGHDNAVNTVPARGGASAFGFDPRARADYGGTSLRPAVEAARAAVRRFYGKAPVKSYFVGCSKGGQEGMMLAQRYPDLFDGIVAGAPGFALPRAAVTEAWDTQALAAVVKANGQPLTPATLAASFSQADFALVGKAILAACDKDDGIVDGMIGAFTRCTSDKVLPAFAHVTCTGAKQDGCLSAAQVGALRRIHDGPRNTKGEPLYASFFWDAGWADMGWRIWKIGGGPMPAINLAMGAPSLASVFTAPPTIVAGGPAAGLDYAMGFDFDRDAPKIYATGGAFVRSAWQDIGARSADLDAFRARAGRLIVPHGVSDPVFSLADTIDWYQAVDNRTGGQAAQFVRLFPVPGMTHCGGGPAADQYDAFAALVAWVEQGEAPAAIAARAGPGTPWPGRTRPLCAFPALARYDGKGDVASAASFRCE